MGLTLKKNLVPARNAAYVRSLPAARMAAMRTVPATMAAVFKAVAPTDTFRYLRGWLLAAIGAGAAGIALPALRRSRRADAIAGALVAQLAAAKNFQTMKEKERDWLIGRNQARGRKFARVLENIASAQARVQKARDALNRFLGSPAALAMMRKYSYVLSGNQRHISGKALNIEVKERVYGGRGEIVHGKDRSVLRLHNLEPHSTAVERRSHVLAAAKRAVAGLGTRTLKKKFIQQLRQSWRLDKKRAA